LLNAAQTADHGVEEIEEDERRVLIEVKDSIAGFVTFAGVMVELLQERGEEFEVLEAVEVFFLDFGFSFACHAGKYARCPLKAQLKCGAKMCGRPSHGLPPRGVTAAPNSIGAARTFSRDQFATRPRHEQTALKQRRDQFNTTR